MTTKAVSHLDTRSFLTTVTPHTRADVEIFEARSLLNAQRKAVDEFVAAQLAKGITEEEVMTVCAADDG
jgi:hypothetical protein